MPMESLAYAQGFRDVVRSLVSREVNRLRPAPTRGTVTAIASDRRSCSVLFPGDDDAVPVRMWTVQPATAGTVGVGDVVRVEGISGDRYVAEVVTGLPFLRAKQASFLGIPTSAGTANAVIDAVTGVLTRSTSSRRYKKDIQPHKFNLQQFLKLRAVTFQERSSDSENRFLGLIAEEIDELDDPELKLLLTRDESGNPEAVNYDRLGVILVPIVQQLIEIITDLEDTVEALETRLENLENA